MAVTSYDEVLAIVEQLAPEDRQRLVKTLSQNCTPLSPSDFFKGAGDEINGRMAARSRILLSFITVSSALIGLSAAENGIALVGIGVGLLSLASSFLSRHHEIMIAYLTAYQRLLIAKHKPYMTPAWQTNFLENPLARVRLSRDNAQLLIYWILGIGALVISVLRELTNTQLTNASVPILTIVLWIFSFSCTIASHRIIRRTSMEREQISRQYGN